MLRSEYLSGQLLRTLKHGGRCSAGLEESEGLSGGAPFEEQGPEGSHVGASEVTGPEVLAEEDELSEPEPWAPWRFSSIFPLRVTSSNLEMGPNPTGQFGYRC